MAISGNFGNPALAFLQSQQNLNQTLGDLVQSERQRQMDSYLKARQQPMDAANMAHQNLKSGLIKAQLAEYIRAKAEDEKMRSGLAALPTTKPVSTPEFTDVGKQWAGLQQQYPASAVPQMQSDMAQWQSNPFLQQLNPGLGDAVNSELQQRQDAYAPMLQDGPPQIVQEVTKNIPLSPQEQMVNRINFRLANNDLAGVKDDATTMGLIRSMTATPGVQNIPGGPSIYVDSTGKENVHWPTEPKDTINEYSDFRKDFIMKNGTEKGVAKAWQENKLALQKEAKMSPSFTINAPGSMTQDAIGLAADTYLLTGQLPAMGMGGASLKMLILNRAAEKAKTSGNDARGIQSDIAGVKADVKSLAFQQKNADMMKSFVDNIDYQVGRIKTISQDLRTFDTRLLNVPLRELRGRVAGSPMQAKIDMYLTEIENEIGKLSTGSAASISELSVGAQAKWAKIHDKNLSMADMISLLEETSRAGQGRYKTVVDQLKSTSNRIGGKGNTPSSGKTVVERRLSKSGKKLVKYSDGSIGEE
jgi:hypothetical protein